MTSSTLERVIKVIVQAAGAGSDVSIDESTPLVGSGMSLDSVMVLELVIDLEKEFSIEIDAQELLDTQAFRTVRALAELVESKVKAGQ